MIRLPCTQDFDRKIHERTNRRRSRSFNHDNQLPILKKIANDANHHLIESASQSTPQETPKRTINANGGCKKTTAPPATENIQRFGGGLRFTPVANSKHVQLPVKRATPINRNLFNQDDESSQMKIVQKKMMAKNEHRQTPVKKKISSEQQQQLNISNKENLANKTTTTTTTPTPKKTLLKWIKEIASPRPTNMPRRISSHNRKSLKNVFATKFFDADKCRSEIIRLFMDRQINCQEKK
mgnify:CR=1 FL=1